MTTRLESILAGIIFVGVLAALMVPEPSARNAVDCSRFGIDPAASKPLGESHATNCHVKSKGGYLLPDPACTPGAINPTVTTKVLQDPAFRTACVRSQATSEQQKTSTYAAYSIPHPSHNTSQDQTCELDHLISIELGGADTLDNIWPQCGPAGVTLDQRFFKRKDCVENWLAKEVKTSKMKLGEAQQGIATNWTQYLDPARCW